jgi:DNA-binding transcriptional LysR family regulator
LPNLRQIEAFKATIELGTVSRAAEALEISQPAASKLLAHLQDSTGLRLFERHKGRLVPTPQGMRLYEEIERIFAGVRQIENAVAVIRREDQGRLLIGVMPALAGSFIQRATMSFLRRCPNVYCSIQSVGSQLIVEHVLERKLDVGFVSTRVDHPAVVTTPLVRHPLLCIMPAGHALARRKVIRPEHLDGVPFVSFSLESYTGQSIANVLARHAVRPNVVLTANVTPTVCQFVAAGLGVSLVHPLFLAGMEKRVAIRPFEPAIPFDFLLCHARHARNGRLIAQFVQEATALANRLSEELANPRRAARS